MWKNEGSLYYKLNIIPSNKVAAFDMDSTLIKTKSGKKFAKDRNDWEFNYDSVLDKINELDGYNIVIFTNQKKFDDEIKDKINNILTKFNASVFVATASDHYRKPMLGMWDFMIKHLNKVNLKKSFYCGDAAGRKDPKDFSACDYMFAHNIGITFYTPEHYFLNIPDTPNVPEFNYDAYLTDKQLELSYASGNELVLMVGLPGCGKSYLARTLNYTVINQDTLKTKQKCIKYTEAAMYKSLSIVIDNTNYNKLQRQMYIELAKQFKYKIRAVVIDNPLDYCKHMNNVRVHHSQGTHKMIPEIVYRTMTKNYEDPILAEGIHSIEHITNKIYSKNKEFTKFYRYMYT
jgi:bifunctional polynucleotide phosphatase/kinase